MGMIVTAMPMPRAPMVRGKAASVDIPDQYTAKLLDFREAAYQTAIENLRANPEHDQIGYYLSLIEGSGHWDPKRPRFRSTYYHNLIAQARLDKLSLLSDVKPSIEVGSNVDAYRDQAKVIDGVIRHEWEKMDLDLMLVAAIDHALFSIGYWKIDSFYPGYMTVTPCGMDAVLPVMPGMDLQASPVVLYRTLASLTYFQNKWPEKAEGLESQLYESPVSTYGDQFTVPGTVPDYSWNPRSPVNRRNMGTRAPAPVRSAPRFPIIELTEMWVDDPSINESSETVTVQDPRFSEDAHNYWYRVAPKQRLWPRKRLVVFAGRKVMYDGPSPYWHGLFPFAQLILRPTVWRPGGLSAYRDLAPINRAINEIGAGTIQAIYQSLYQTVITRDSAVKPGDWDRFFPGVPGAKLKMGVNSNPANDIQWSKPPVLPAYVFLFLTQYLLQAFDRMAGTLDVASLQKKNQIPGGETIEQMKDAMQTVFRLESRQIDVFLRNAGTQAVSHIVQNYTADRRLEILGPMGLTYEDTNFNPASMVPGATSKYEHYKRFPLNVKAGSTHGGSRDRLKQIAISLFRLGGISREEMLRIIEWPGDIDQIKAELAEQLAMLPPDATGKGQVPRLGRGERTGNAY